MTTPPRASEPFELLLCAARGALHGGGAEQLEQIAAGISDWDATLVAASEHKVIPLLARALAASAAVPLRTRRELDKRYIMRLARGAALARELREITGEFRAAGIGVLAYKGPAFAAMAYADPRLRHPASDLDLLLHRADILRARDLLASRGFRSILTAEQEQHFFRHRYHLHCERQAPEMHVELHWALTPAYWPFRIDERRLWGRARAVTVDGAEVPAPDPECMLLALCAHGAKESWRTLSQVVDVAQLLRAHPGLDWDWVLAEARRMRRNRVLWLGLRLAHDLMGTRLPEEVARQVQQDEAVGSLAASTREHLRVHYAPTGADFHSYALRVWHHPADRLRYLWYRSKLLPDKVKELAEPSAKDREIVALSQRLSFLYLFVRPLRALRQHDLRVILRRTMRGL